MILFYSIEIEYKYNIFRFESNKSIFICHFIYKTDHERTDLTITANDHMAEQNASKIIRDNACTQLKELVDEAREAGKYMSWRNPNRYRECMSKYLQKFNRNSNKGDEVVE